MNLSTQDIKFIRSQDHLAIWKGKGGGRLFTYAEAFAAYGEEVVSKVVEQGSVPIVRDSSEPAKTLKRRREHLNVSIAELAKRTGLSSDTIQKAENPNSISKIRDIERICIVLNLDERNVGFSDNSKFSDTASLRFKTLIHTRSTSSESLRLALSEALWTITRTEEFLSDEDKKLRSDVKQWAAQILREVYQETNLYYMQGIFLARHFRKYLGLDLTQPIPSTLDIWENTLRIHVSNMHLQGNLAGVTIYTTEGDGCIINKREDIPSSTRRLTSMHEMCHYLFDSKDQYFDTHIDRLNIDSLHIKDDNTSLEEKRANTFAVEFLCPKAAIKKTFSAMASSGSFEGLTEEEKYASLAVNISNLYGISISSAVWHVINHIVRKDNVHRSIKSLTSKYEPSYRIEKWDLKEIGYRNSNNASSRVNLSRIGLFSTLVMKAAKINKITDDSAASLLGTSIEALKEINMASVNYDAASPDPAV